MHFGRTPRWMSRDRARPGLHSFWIVLPVCLLLFAITGDLPAAGGSTRLTIRIDQSVVDQVIAWRIANGLPVPSSALRTEREDRPAAPPSPGIRAFLEHALPAVRIGLEQSLNPQAVDRIIRQLQQDTLVVFEGRSEHAGGAAGTCISDPEPGHVQTVHSI